MVLAQVREFRRFVGVTHLRGVHVVELYAQDSILHNAVMSVLLASAVRYCHVHYHV